MGRRAEEGRYSWEPFLPFLPLSTTAVRAGVGGSIVPNFPGTLNRGQVFDAELEITNNSNGNDTFTDSLGNTTGGHNAKDHVRVTGIFFTPSCGGVLSLFCASPADLDPNVFEILTPSTTPAAPLPIGTQGTCVGKTFDVSGPDAFGEWQFTPTDFVDAGARAQWRLTGASLLSPRQWPRCQQVQDQFHGQGEESSHVRRRASPPAQVHLSARPSSSEWADQRGDGSSWYATGTDLSDVTAPVLTIVKTPDGQTINAGDTATFTMVVTNTGNGTAQRTSR